MVPPHRTGAHLFILLLALLALPGLFLELPVYGVAAPLAFGFGLGCLALGTLSACVFYVAAERAQGMDLWQTLLLLPLLMAAGVGLSVTNTSAVLGAIFGRRSAFIRTPKYAGGATGRLDPAARRRRLAVPAGSVEIGLGLAMAAAIVLSPRQPFHARGNPVSAALRVRVPFDRRAAAECPPDLSDAAAQDAPGGGGSLRQSLRRSAGTARGST